MLLQVDINDNSREMAEKQKLYMDNLHMCVLFLWLHVEVTEISDQ